MVKLGFLAVGAAACSPLCAAGGKPKVIKHVVVYREAGRFAGWPANHGAWAWGNKMLVGFEVGYFDFSKRDHAIDRSRPAEHVLARSLDGGETWTLEKPEGLKPPADAKIAGVPGEAGQPLRDCSGGIDFTDQNFALTARMESVDAGQSRFYFTLDRGKSWAGPYHIPNFGQPGTAARTDYLIDGAHDLTIFLTAAKRNKREGRIICVRTQDGAKSWNPRSFVCPEPPGGEYAIMPSSVRLPGGPILTSIRYRDFIDLYRSDDDGLPWKCVSRPADHIGGNPPSMLRLKDGCIAITYGYRRKPFGIRARLSADEGRTWSSEIVLRADGSSWELGYPRTLERPDGKLATAYYFNTDEASERFIGAPIWDPGEKQGGAAVAFPFANGRASGLEFYKVETAVRIAKEKSASTREKEVDSPKLESRALHKGLELMERLASSTGAMSLAVLAPAVGLGKSSALRLLQTLVAEGSVARNSDGSYVLNRPWVQVATKDWLARLIRTASVEMERLSSDLAETVSLAALFEDHIRVIHVIEGPRHIRMSNYQDRILPPYASSLGKAITAFQTPERVQTLLNVYGVYSFTERTMTEPVRIREELARIRKDGYASEHEETVTGGCCFAVPIRGGDEPVRAALSISVPSIRVTKDLERLLPQLLLEAGKRIQAGLGAKLHAPSKR